MNINSSNILSMFASAEGLDSLQQMIPDGRAESIDFTEFSNALMEKINQLQGLDAEQSDIENIALNSLVVDNKLHEFAGFSSSQGMVKDFSSIFGNALPPGNKLENQIDLEATMDVLASVLNTLEQGKQGELDLVVPVDKAIDSIKAIQQAIPENPELNDQLDQIINKLEALKTQDLELDTSLTEGGGVEPLDEIEKAEQQVEPDNELELHVEAIDAEVEDQYLSPIDEIADLIQQLKPLLAVENSDLQPRIDQLAIAVDDIKVAVSNKLAAQLDRPLPAIATPLDGVDESTAELDIENQIATLVASLGLANSADSAISTSLHPELKTTVNKENLSLRQMIEERSVGLPVKSESETLLQKGDLVTKDSQNGAEAVLMAKQNEGRNVLDDKDPELNIERTLPKFATDIANLNRAVMTENKAEISPMTKHFSHPEWNKEIGEKVVWMHKQAIPSAELRLNPAHLGPISIKIDATQEQVTVAFTAQHAAVKEAIDAALPKLREMFSAQQLNLVEVSVSQQDAGQKQQRGFSQMAGDSGKGDKNANEMAETELAENTMDIADEIEAGRAIASNGLLSIFA